MYVAKWTPENGWAPGRIERYGPLSMEPAAQILNYGQGLFEGMKAVTSAKGRVVLFRPADNAERMRQGAARMSMAHLPTAVFLRGVQELVQANLSHVRAGTLNM